MNSQPVFEPVRTHICGHSIASLAAEFGTPAYFYDAAVIRERVEQLQQFDVIRFAQKANSNIAILHLLRELGVVVDAVSSGEIFRAQKAGFEPQQDIPSIVYTADIFDRESLDRVVADDIHVNVGSIDMIKQYGERCSDGEITIRINPGFGHGHSHKTNTGGEHSKHGIWLDDVPQAVSIAEELGLRISGVHMHIGSGTDFEHLSQVCDAMADVVRKVGPSVTSISAGGGLPTPYQAMDKPIDTERYFAIWNETRQRLQTEFGHPIRLEIEPGRFLVAECGYLVAEIRAIKTMGQNLFYLLDAGFNNLARPVMYGSYHPMTLVHRQTREKLVMHDVIVGGPLCESGDIFTQEEGGYVSRRELPEAEVGDFLVIECAGAYGFVMSSNYNSKPMAAEILLDGDKAHLIRQRQNENDLVRGERIP